MRLNPPPAAAAGPDDLAAGAAAYATYCGNCHGAGAINLGILPDLRSSAALASPQAWTNIVTGGGLADGGMASFARVLDDAGAESIRAWVIARAREDAAAVGQD
jgi:mono/diheme cytochrome c family protein